MRYKILLLLILLFFSACGNEDVFTCKEYAQQNNFAYLDENLSPIQKGKVYVVRKGTSYIEPVLSSMDIKFELSSIVLDMQNSCVKIEQDKNDTNEAEIIFR